MINEEPAMQRIRERAFPVEEMACANVRKGKMFGAHEEMCLVEVRKSSVRLQKSTITDQARPL